MSDIFFKIKWCVNRFRGYNIRLNRYEKERGILKPLICLTLMGCVLTLMGAVPSVGIVKSTGDFRVDGSTIRGNSTVFEGNLIETTAARSTVQLGEAQITLLPNSRAKVYRDHTVLESGSELMRNGEKHMIEAATLQIASAAKDGVVLVAMGGPNHVTVFASSGTAQVRTAAGLLVASLRPGMGLAFTPQAGAATAMQMAGVVESTNGKFFLTDTTSKTRVELRGTDLAKFKGKSVQITGSIIPGAAAAGGASQVVQVTKIEQLSARAAGRAAGAAAGGTAGAAAGGTAGATAGGTAGTAAGGAAGAAAAGAGAGATIGGVGVWTVVIVGAAAAGATVGGLAIAGAGPFASNP